MIMFLSFKSDDEKNKFEYIYDKYKRLLLYKSYEILKDHNLAEDSVNEAFMRIYKNLHKIHDVDSNMTISFLVTIVKNTSLSLVVKEKKYAKEEIPETSEDDFNLEDFVISKITSTNIYKILDKLDEESRSIFLLKFAKDLSHRDISKILNISENNVAIKLHRAKKKLADLVKKEVMNNS